VIGAELAVAGEHAPRGGYGFTSQHSWESREESNRAVQRAEVTDLFDTESSFKGEK